MNGFVRMAPAFILLALTIWMVLAQPWVKTQEYSASGDVSGVSGWSQMDEQGKLRLHLSAEGNASVSEVRLEGGEACKVAGQAGASKETDVYADCGPGVAGAPYKGTVAMTYGGSEVTGMFSGWRE